MSRSSSSTGSTISRARLLSCAPACTSSALRERSLVVDDGRKRLDVELDELRCVFGERSAARDDERVWITDEADLSLGEYALGGGRCHVEHRRRAHRTGEQRIEVLGGEDRDHARRVLRGGHVEPHDASPGDVTACERGMEHARHHDIVDVATATGQQAGVLLAVDGRADESGRGREEAHSLHWHFHLVMASPRPRVTDA